MAAELQRIYDLISAVRSPVYGAFGALSRGEPRSGQGRPGQSQSRQGVHWL
jgi:hypothetical protein